MVLFHHLCRTSHLYLCCGFKAFLDIHVTVKPILAEQSTVCKLRVDRTVELNARSSIFAYREMESKALKYPCAASAPGPSRDRVEL